MSAVRSDSLSWRHQYEQRSERRFVVSPELAATISRQVASRLAPQVFDRGRPIAYTRTTYYDTPRHALYRTLHPDCRVRLREYGAAVDESASPELSGISYLELKSIEGEWRTKIRLRLPSQHGVHRADGFRLAWDRLLAELPADLVLPCDLRDANLVPRVTTVYRRRSWASEDGAVRITLDSGLIGSSPILVADAPDRFEPVGSIDFGDRRVVEVKSVGAVPDWLERVLGGVPVTEQFSKFRWGVAALYPVDQEANPCAVAN